VAAAVSPLHLSRCECFCRANTAFRAAAFVVHRLERKLGRFWPLVGVALLSLGTALPAEDEDYYASQGFKYPGKVDLAPLRLLEPATQTNWLRVQPAGEDCWRMDRPKFFANGDALTIRMGCSRRTIKTKSK
jgi:hypothetical protein